jgi:hypothetical protein
MRALSFTAGAMMLSLIAVACAPASNRPAEAPERDPPTERRPPPGTRVDTWPSLGAWSATKREMPGIRDPFLWERPEEPKPPKAQVPLRLHRPVE